VDILITTTSEEDAAILKIAEEQPDEFVRRHVRHQLNFVVQRAKPSLDEVYAKAAPEDKVVLDQIRDKTRVVRGAEDIVP